MNGELLKVGGRVISVRLMGDWEIVSCIRASAMIDFVLVYAERQPLLVVEEEMMMTTRVCY